MITAFVLAPSPRQRRGEAAVASRAPWVLAELRGAPWPNGTLVSGTRERELGQSSRLRRCVRPSTSCCRNLRVAPVSALSGSASDGGRDGKRVGDGSTNDDFRAQIARHGAQSVLDRLRRLELQTRPPASKSSARSRSDRLLRERFEALPEHVKTDSQILGRITPGCEGTQGVFPGCNFGCTPCYHSADANRVRSDGLHTAVEIARQMELLHEQRGDVAHCQLIGGELSLLAPDDVAAIISVMKAFGRLPMLFTHGDFDESYLQALALDASGRKRFERLDWAVHFDRFMVGRRRMSNADLASGGPVSMASPLTASAAPAAPAASATAATAISPKTSSGSGKSPKGFSSELELNPYREQFMQKVKRLEKEHGVRSYVAHNFTVQEDNLMEIADVVRSCKHMGFRLMSFQPAARVGYHKRWAARPGDFVQRDESEIEHRALSEERSDHGESVWREIERGAGCRLPYKVFQTGDVRCNRTVWGAFIGSDDDCVYAPFLDDECPADLRVRDAFLKHFGLAVMPLRPLILKMVRVLFRHPWALPMALSWLNRYIARAGALRLVKSGFHVAPVTFVMHRFMDADDVKPAWDMLQRGELAQTGVLKETQERLFACSYAMAHPNSNKLVPACVQHSVYDPAINIKLAQELPLGSPSRPAPQEVRQVLAAAADSERRSHC